MEFWLFCLYKLTELLVVMKYSPYELAISLIFHFYPIGIFPPIELVSNIKGIDFPRSNLKEALVLVFSQTLINLLHNICYNLL